MTKNFKDNKPIRVKAAKAIKSIADEHKWWMTYHFYLKDGTITLERLCDDKRRHSVGLNYDENFKHIKERFDSELGVTVIFAISRNLDSDIDIDKNVNEYVYITTNPDNKNTYRMYEIDTEGNFVQVSYELGYHDNTLYIADDFPGLKEIDEEKRAK